ncbi:hypothetical protein EVC24_140 [Rhizobium phage RHph_I4]|nr:hypothetical protein EVC24_140 [Rhizobium phage RHph_I4]
MGSIFANKNHIVDAYVSVLQDANVKHYTYYAFMTFSRDISERCEANARLDGRKVLYRIRIKARRDFPIIGKKPKRGYIISDSWHSEGPVVIHKDDGKTLLVSRTDRCVKQRFWISKDRVLIGAEKKP